jgi:diguanylate cyclase (GGDEF)-like protein/PAS domain S-box-containing protein
MTTRTGIIDTGISLEEFAQLADNVPAMLAVFDSKTLQCVYANRRYAKLAGREPHELIGKTVGEIIGVDAEMEIRPHIDRVLQKREPVSYVRTTRLANGEIRDHEVSLVPDTRADTKFTYVLISDVTRYRETERAMEQSAQRLWKFMAASEEGIAFHIDGIVTDVNQALADMLGFEIAEFVGRPTLDFVPVEEHERVRAVIASGAETTYESRARHKTRGAIPVEYIVRDMVWGGAKQRMVIVRDLSERKAIEQRIRFLALHDALSGLPNRASLDEHIAELVARSPERAFATLFIDVDQLKRVNDSMGHAAGDTLLSELAERLARLCNGASPLNEEAWLARIGGDEFVITYSMRGRDDLEQFVDSVVHGFAEPFRIEHREIHASASIGIALFPQDGRSPSQLLKNADAAMYLAKKEGRDAVRYFDESLARHADYVLETEQALAVAIRESQFRLFFQPLVSSDGKQLLGAEALLRWQHPTRGLLGPNEFVQMAEDSFLVQPIGQWVLIEALKNVKRWISKGWKDARVSINLANNELRDGVFAKRVLEALEAQKLDGRHLELEFTERMLMEDQRTLPKALASLRKANVSLAIDDFGTGFSSLLRLRSLPISTLKIDQSFVADLPESHEALTIVTAVLQLGRGLTLDVVAEGVETEGQRECLELLGCAEMQGFLFAKPMPSEDFEKWIDEHRVRNADAGVRIRHRLRQR